MSAKSFKIIFNNPTEKTWHVGVYQKYPDFPGMSIVWKKKRVARHTSNVVLSFTLKYGVSIGGVDGGVEEEEADLGKAYQVIAEQKAWALDPKPIQDISGEDEIFVYNYVDASKVSGVSDKACPIDIGFTIDGDPIAPMVKGVVKNTRATFRVHPSYFLALYDSVTKGQMVDSGVNGKAIEVRFKGAETEMTVNINDSELTSKNQIMPKMPVNTNCRSCRRLRL